MNSRSMDKSMAEPVSRSLRRRRRVVLLGDVGVVDGRYHLGDEAMLGAAVRQLRERGDVEITVLSRNPQETASRYGVTSVQGFGEVFLADAGDDSHWLALEDLLGVARDPLAESARHTSTRGGVESSVMPGIAAIRAADAVIVAGGGNLNSAWPNLLFERLAAAELASEFGIDLVLSGQSIGPRVDHRHQGPLARIVQVARLIGVREQGSIETLERLGLSSEKIVHTPDDALALLADSRDPTTSPAAVNPYVTATFARHSGMATPARHLADAVAAVRVLAEITELPVLLVAHEGRIGSSPASGDARFHEEIAGSLADIDVRVLPQADSEATTAVTGNAELVVSMRYHQIVDALGQSRACVGISVDDYGHNKVGGALCDAGLDAYAVTSNTVSSGSFAMVVADAWLHRVEISKYLDGFRDARQRRLSSWWDLVCDGVSSMDAPGGVNWVARVFPLSTRLAVATAARERGWFLAACEQFDRLRTEADMSPRATRPDAVGAVFDYRLAEMHADNELLRERNENLEAALAASRELLIRLGNPLFAKTLVSRRRAPAGFADESQLAALLRTRTLTWSRGARRIYRGIRTGFRDWDVL